MKESEILKKIQILFTRLGSRLLRNNVGVLKDKNGRHVRYGLGVGSSDLIGWTSIIIKPEMIGRKVAVFTACEVKSQKGQPTPEQGLFLSAVEASGGISILAHSEEEAEEKFNQIKSRLS